MPAFGDIMIQFEPTKRGSKNYIKHSQSIIMVMHMLEEGKRTVCVAP